MKHNANYNDEPVKKERGNRRRQKNQIEKELLNRF
jgi:hypothetical protein